jgi:hypothetical protein
LTSPLGPRRRLFPTGWWLASRTYHRSIRKTPTGGFSKALLPHAFIWQVVSVASAAYSREGPSLAGRPRSPTKLDHVLSKPGRQKRVDIIWGNRNPRPHPASFSSGPETMTPCITSAPPGYLTVRRPGGKCVGVSTIGSTCPFSSLLGSSLRSPRRPLFTSSRPWRQAQPGADRGPCQHRVVAPLACSTASPEVYPLAVFFLCPLKPPVSGASNRVSF